MHPQGGEEDTSQGREKPGEAMTPNNSGHSEMLVVGLVTWHLQPEARPCDAVGGMLLRVFRVPEGSRIHSTPVRVGFRCMLEFTCRCRALLLDIHSLSSHMQVKIKCSKTDPFRDPFMSDIQRALSQ